MAASSQMDRIIWDCFRHCVTGKSVSVKEPLPTQLIGRARNHNLLPLIAAALPDLSAASRQPLLTASRQRRIRTLVMTQEMLRVVAECAKAGIRIVPLKGVALANTVYPSPTLRFFDDLDLLVEPDKMEAALAIIQQLGYLPHPRGRADWHHSAPQTHPKHGTTIELHSDLVRRFGRKNWSLTDIWARTERHTIHGQSVELLTTNDALIHTALHARHHLFEKPTFLLDTALLLKQVNSDQWQRLIEQTKAAGALLPFAHTINLLVKHQLIEPRPAIAIGRWQLAIANRVHGWHDFSPRRETLRGGALPKLIELSLMDSLADSWAMARTLLAPDEEFISGTYRSRWGRLSTRLGLLGKQLFLGRQSTNE